MDNLAGQTLGKVHILDEIGSGCLATGYHGKDTSMGRDVALKILESLPMCDEALVECFQREARAA